MIPRSPRLAAVAAALLAGACAIAAAENDGDTATATGESAAAAPATAAASETGKGKDSGGAEPAVLAGSWGQGLYCRKPGADSKWEQYGSGLPQQFITFLTVDSKGTLYCGFDLPGVWRSKDYGLKWERTGANPPAAPSGLAAHPANSDILLVTTWGKGAWWSEDAGRTWVADESPSPFMRKPLAVPGGERPLFYAVVDDGRVFSCRGVRGEWKQVAKFPRGLKVWDLAVKDAGKGTLVAATNAGAALITADGGISYPSLGVSSAFARSVVVDGERVLIGTWGYGVIEWTPKGARFINDGMADMNSFALALISSEAIAKASSSGGSGPASWTAWNNGLQSYKVSSIAYSKTNPQIMYCGTSSGVHRSDDGGRTWKPKVKGLTDQGIYHVAVSPSNSDLVYCCTWNGGVARSNDGGNSWEQVNQGLSLLNVYYVSIDPANPQVLYAMTWGAGVFRSEDGGDSWEDFTGDITSLNGYFVFCAPVTPNPIIASLDNNGIYLLSDGSWVDANKGMNFGWVMDMAQDPLNGKRLIASTAGSGAFISEDGGLSWKQSNDGLTSQNGKGVAFNPGKLGSVYIGTDGGGIFKSVNGGASWSSDNTGLASLKVKEVLVTPAGVAYVATENGIFVKQD